jgi:hypothetical protein
MGSAKTDNEAKLSTWRWAAILFCNWVAAPLFAAFGAVLDLRWHAPGQSPMLHGCRLSLRNRRQLIEDKALHVA